MWPRCGLGHGGGPRYGIDPRPPPLPARPPPLPAPDVFSLLHTLPVLGDSPLLSREVLRVGLPGDPAARFDGATLLKLNLLRTTPAAGKEGGAQPFSPGGQGAIAPSSNTSASRACLELSGGRDASLFHCKLLMLIADVLRCGAFCTAQGGGGTGLFAFCAAHTGRRGGGGYWTLCFALLF